MDRPLIARFLACAALLGTLGGCDVLGPDRADHRTLYVAPAMSDCVGVGPQRCLLVKEEPDEEWSYFYDRIVGFTYEPGYSYTLLVARHRVAHPPADGSSLEYRLVRILARDAAPPA